jgi:hypothetical protein
MRPRHALVSALGLLLAPGLSSTLTGQDPPRKEDEQILNFLTLKPLQAAQGDDALRKLQVARYISALLVLQGRVDQFQIGFQVNREQLASAASKLLAAGEGILPAAEQLRLRQRYVDILRRLEEMARVQQEVGVLPGVAGLLW